MGLVLKVMDLSKGYITIIGPIKQELEKCRHL